MPNAIVNIAVLVGVAAIAGGGAFYFATRQSPPPAAPPPAAAQPPQAASTAPAAGQAPFDLTPPAQTPSAQAATEQTSPVQTAAVQTPASPPQEADPSVWPSGVAPEKFTTFAQPFTLTRDSAAYTAASGDAPQLYPLKAGTSLVTTDKSTDGKWVISITEDGHAAYLLTADLGPYDPNRHPAVDLPDSVAGPARVIDTATLVINGQVLPLNGVTGLSGSYADKLQKIIDVNGSQVACTLSGQAYLCRLPNGQDIARTSLFNGAARASDDATADYRAQEATAKTFHRGVWN